MVTSNKTNNFYEKLFFFSKYIVNNQLLCHELQFIIKEDIDCLKINECTGNIILSIFH